MPDASTTSLPVEHLCSVTFELGESSMLTIDAPSGSRTIVTPTGGRFEGPRLAGTILAPTADWATASADGSLRADVRSLWRTDDGADLLVTYTGVVRTEAGFDIRIAPRFEVGDERYRWLNTAHCVGFGTIDTSIRYDIFLVP